MLQEGFNVNFHSGAGKIQIESGDDLWMQHSEHANLLTGNYHIRTATSKVGFIYNQSTPLVNINRLEIFIKKSSN